MATELAPGVLTRMFAGVQLRGEAAAGAALTAVALAVEKQAKINASSGQHAYGTRTPASRGSGPARISGNLVRSITHTEPVRHELGWECRVGVASGSFPYYGRRRTDAAHYGQYLELGKLRGGAAYPFLRPAFHMVANISVYSIFARLYRL